MAFAVADDPAQLAVRERVEGSGLRPTPVIDRSYFHSVYFREPGGVLYELATSVPGFTIDEPVERLGERLMLPPRYEAHREEIEAALSPFHLPTSAAAAEWFAAAPGERGRHERRRPKIRRGRRAMRRGCAHDTA